MEEKKANVQGNAVNNKQPQQPEIKKKNYTLPLILSAGILILISVLVMAGLTNQKKVSESQPAPIPPAEPAPIVDNEPAKAVVEPTVTIIEPAVAPPVVETISGQPPAESAPVESIVPEVSAAPEAPAVVETPVVSEATSAPEAPAEVPSVTEPIVTEEPVPVTAPTAIPTEIGATETAPVVTAPVVTAPETPAVTPVQEPVQVEPPQDAKGFFKEGEDFYYKGKFDDAIKDFQKAVELDPKYADAYCEMGVSYMEKNEWDTAVSVLNKCIEIDANHPKAQYAVAVSYARKTQPDVKLAREHFETAKKLGFVYPQWFEDFLKRLESGEQFPAQ